MNQSTTVTAALALLHRQRRDLLGSGRSDAEVEAEIAFAQGLAADWGFVDLAEEVVAGLEKDVSGKSAERLGLVQCELYAEAARAERDPARRRELYKAAIDAYNGFIEKNSVSTLREQAESRLVETAFTYGRYIERDLEEMAGEEADTLSSEMVTVMTESVAKTEDLITNLESLGAERTQAQTLELYKLMMYRGQMLAVIARNDPENTYFFDRSIESLMELVFLAGDGTPPALTAYNAIGEVYSYQEKWEEASAYHEAVIEQTIMRDLESWQTQKEERDLQSGDVALYFRFLEMATPGAINAYAAQGDNETALSYAMHYLNTWRREGVALEPAGYESLLAVAKSLLDSNGFIGGNLNSGEGKWYATEEDLEAGGHRKRFQTDTTSVAMDLANQVNAENKGSYLQVRAQRLISEISQLPGMSVSPDLQLQAAEGEYFGDNLQGSIDLLRRMLADLEASDEQTRLEFGGKAYALLGDALRKQERDVEAAIAYRTAIEDFRGTDANLNHAWAKRYHGMTKILSRNATADSDALATMLTSAENLVVDTAADAEGASSPDAIQWGRAEKLYDAGDWDGARAAYQEIDKHANFGERAIVKAAVCLFRKKEMDEAVAELDTYLTSFVEDPNNDSESQTRQAYRRQAMGVAEFFRGLGAAQKKDHGRVIELLGGYHDEYDDQQQLANWTLELVMKAHLEQGSLNDARAAYDTMADKFADSQRTARAGAAIYNEIKKQVTDQQGPDRVAGLTQMAELMEKTRAAKTAGYPEMWNEALHWSELGDLATMAGDDGASLYAKAQAPLEELNSRFADSEEYGSKVRKQVQPKLGEMYLGQGKVVDANALLAPLVLEEGSKPAKQTVVAWVRSTTGWLELGGAAGPVKYVPGAGGDDAAYQEAIDVLGRIRKGRDVDNYGCDGYEIASMIVVSYYSWGQQDSAKLDSARNQLRQFKLSLDNGWTQLDQICSDPENTRDEALRMRLGERVLSSRFQWLEKALGL